MNEEKANHARTIAYDRRLDANAPPLDLPESITTLCNGWDLESKFDTAIELLTFEPGGFPHVAHLSSGELQLDSHGRLRIALWSSSQTNANLRNMACATLMFICADGLYEVRCRCVAMQPLPDHDTLDAFLMHPLSVRDKSAPYAQVLSGIRYRLVDTETTLQRWYRVQAALASCF
ncbi:hypothetical protein R70006_05536 [Paraburkholderia domus]|uniref:hypothetical protein n=1 Tax=Paraburkholderia domus TaxID=2793075 RepID=UPI001911F7C3|nr:hypothetical protein [Paraburkholderia domus]MBK5052289.1 hypothetical protein [Burkholderia sp. R-70006]CAE6806179.1 hypothetical protein R70006_05536 [Paraburkholderia domus]CAE6939861.1 hypothetical protein R75471_05282 [Paraburkholderia domus]